MYEVIIPIDVMSVDSIHEIRDWLLDHIGMGTTRVIDYPVFDDYVWAFQRVTDYKGLSMCVAFKTEEDAIACKLFWI